MQKTVRKILRVVANYDPDYYDMYEDANEAFFAQLYVPRILQHAEAAGIRPPAAGSATGVPSIADRRPTLLEAGCQTGRLAIPFAKMGFRVTGIDTSPFALRRARAHAKAAGADATFIQGDLIERLRSRPRPQYDIVVCAEVVYLSRRYGEMLEALAGAVKPGGLLCVSHRPRLYYLLEALRRYDVAAATAVLTTSEGPFGQSSYFNWQSEEELRTRYGALGLQWLAMYPIDRLAWLSGADPAKLTEAQRGEWLKLEHRLSGETGMCARYVLVVAAKPQQRAGQGVE